jgi:NAD(P)-dependent dehydrogenase (short-subunit alcohol dehydrogenase family)
VVTAAADLFDLAGQTAVVTGAGSGLGAAIAGGLAAFGATVVAVDVDMAAAEAVVAAIRARGGDADAVECDVTDRPRVESAVLEAETKHGPVRVLATSAGIGMRSPAADMSDRQWSRVIDVNLTGTWNWNQVVGRRMAERRAGSIINVASVAGLVGVTTGNVNYAASKGGVIAMMRTLALEWAPAHVRVNALAPTHFRTPLIENAIRDQPELLDYYVGNIPLGRIGEPAEIVGPAVFLASAASSMVTGHVLAVDGGHTAR